MDIDEICRKREFMEDVIKAAVICFESETGTHVDSIRLDRVAEIASEHGRVYNINAMVVL